MATRRRGGADLDDLKARLGLSDDADAPSGSSTDASSDAADESDDASDASDASGEESDPLASSPLASAPGAPAPIAAPVAPKPAPAPAPAPRPAAPAAPAARASAPADDDEAAFARGESDEKYEFNFDPNAYDPTLKAPGRSVTGFVIIISVLCIGLGTVMGLGLGLGNEKRMLVNDTIANSGRVLERVEGVATRLTELNTRVASLPVESTYNQEFQDLLTASFTEGAPVFDGASLATAGSVLANDPRVTSPLLEYAVETATLAGLVRTHLELTALDNDAIQRELAGNADAANYGIAFSLDMVLNGYNASIAENPTPYQPPASERVTFENLDTVMIPADAPPEQQVAAYNVVNSAGAPIQVPVHDLLVLPRAQLLPSITDDTPIFRYRQRAARIKGLLNDVVLAQQDIVSGLRDMAEQPQVFAF